MFSPQSPGAGGQVAQLVEHRTENPGVGSSTLPLPIRTYVKSHVGSARQECTELPGEVDSKSGSRCPFRNLATSFHSSGQFAGFMGFSGYCYGDRSHSGYNIMDVTNAIPIRRDCFSDRSPARSTGGIGSCAFHSTGSGVPLPADSPSRRQGQSHQSSNCCRIPL